MSKRISVRIALFLAALLALAVAAVPVLAQPVRTVVVQDVSYALGVDLEPGVISARSSSDAGEAALAGALATGGSVIVGGLSVVVYVVATANPWGGESSGSEVGLALFGAAGSVAGAVAGAAIVPDRGRRTDVAAAVLGLVGGVAVGGAIQALVPGAEAPVPMLVAVPVVQGIVVGVMR